MQDEGSAGGAGGQLLGCFGAALGLGQLGGSSEAAQRQHEGSLEAWGQIWGRLGQIMVS